MKNKIFLTLASILTAASMLAQDFEYQGVKYTVLDEDAKTAKTASALSIDVMFYGAEAPNADAAGDVIIYETVYNGTTPYTVTEIGECSFYNNSNITSIYLPNTVTRIGIRALAGLTGLTQEVFCMPSSLTEIGSNGIDGPSSSITTVIIQSDFTTGSYALRNWKGLKNFYYTMETPPTSFGDMSNNTYKNLWGASIINAATCYVPSQAAVTQYKTKTTGTSGTLFANYQVYSSVPFPETPVNPGPESAEPEQPTGNDFTLVTNVAQIGNEAEVIILDSQDAFAMGKEYYRQTQNSQYQRTAVTDFVKNSDGTITPGDEVCIATITKKDNGYVIFAPIASNPAMGYLNVNTVLDTYDREGQASVLTITIDETTGVAIVTDGKYYMTAYSNNIQTFFDSNNSSDESGAHRNLKFYVRGGEAPEDQPSVNAPMHLMINTGEEADLSSYFADVEVAGWTSSDASIAAVDNGTVTGQQYGNAVVTARKADGSAWADIKVMVCPMLTVAYPEGALTSHLVPYGSPIDIDLTPLDGWSFCTASIDGRDISAQVDMEGHLFSHTTMTQDKLVNIVTAKSDNPSWADDIRIIVNGRDVTITGAEILDNVYITDYSTESSNYDWNIKEIHFGEGGVFKVKISRAGEGEAAYFRMVIE